MHCFYWRVGTAQAARDLHETTGVVGDHILHTTRVDTSQLLRQDLNLIPLRTPPERCAQSRSRIPPPHFNKVHGRPVSNQLLRLGSEVEVFSIGNKLVVRYPCSETGPNVGPSEFLHE